MYEYEDLEREKDKVLCGEEVYLHLLHKKGQRKPNMKSFRLSHEEAVQAASSAYPNEDEQTAIKKWSLENNLSFSNAEGEALFVLSSGIFKAHSPQYKGVLWIVGDFHYGLPVYIYEERRSIKLIKQKKHTPPSMFISKKDLPEIGEVILPSPEDLLSQERKSVAEMIQKEFFWEKSDLYFKSDYEKIKGLQKSLLPVVQKWLAAVCVPQTMSNTHVWFLREPQAQGAIGPLEELDEHIMCALTQAKVYTHAEGWGGYSVFLRVLIRLVKELDEQPYNGESNLADNVMNAIWALIRPTSRTERRAFFKEYETLLKED